MFKAVKDKLKSSKEIEARLINLVDKIPEIMDVTGKLAEFAAKRIGEDMAKAPGNKLRDETYTYDKWGEKKGFKADQKTLDVCNVIKKLSSYLNDEYKVVGELAERLTNAALMELDSSNVIKKLRKTPDGKPERTIETRDSLDTTARFIIDLIEIKTTLNTESVIELINPMLKEATQIMMDLK